MATANEVITYIRRRTGGDAKSFDESLALDCIDQALRNLSSEYDWSFFRVEEDLNTVPAYTTGTVSVNHLSASVTGSGTSWAANVAAGDMITFGDGRCYLISVVGGNTSLTLSAPYVSDSAANLSGASYTIVRRDYAPAQTVKWIKMLIDRRGVNQLVEIPMGVMEGLWRNGFWQGNPARWSLVNASANARKIRLWPGPQSTVYPLTVVYQRKPTEVNPASLDSDLDWPKYENVLLTAAWYEATLLPTGRQYMAAAQAAFVAAKTLAMSEERGMLAMQQVGAGRFASSGGGRVIKFTSTGASYS